MPLNIISIVEIKSIPEPISANLERTIRNACSLYKEQIVECDYEDERKSVRIQFINRIFSAIENLDRVTVNKS